MKIGEVRVVSVYVPSMVKEKKLFVAQLTKALEVINAEEELIIGGDFNMVEDSNRDSVPKRDGEARPGAVSSRREANERDGDCAILDRIYTTPRLFQSKLKFNHLSKFPFTTHHLIQLTRWIANVETGKPLYKIRPNITNNSNHVDFVTAFDLPNYSDLNLKLDVFCIKTIQRAKTLSHYLRMFEGNGTTNNDICGKVTATSSPTALLNINETYVHLHKTAKNQELTLCSPPSKRLYTKNGK
ncbi:unnamed protein product [Ambrosiozyma monospora]|uniref:Unnamed protein product n=1 Tax=Ambrosiozyma monospora TaxID=43982 RepID=A0A9W6Z8J4_AMBMO|nr:unnamed protein product [Ambrosiozyma monospora]